MEPQVTICCGKRSQKCCCLYRILYIIISLFAFVLGIILGALTEIVSIIGIVYFLAIATILLIMAIILAIYIWCKLND